MFHSKLFPRKSPTRRDLIRIVLACAHHIHTRAALDKLNKKVAFCEQRNMCEANVRTELKPLAGVKNRLNKAQVSLV